MTEAVTNIADDSIHTTGPVHVLRLEGFQAVSHFLIALIAALFITLPVSIYALVKTELYAAQVDAKLDEANWRARQMGYWAQTVDAQLEARGVRAPPLKTDYAKKGGHP